MGIIQKIRILILIVVSQLMADLYFPLEMVLQWII